MRMDRRSMSNQTGRAGRGRVAPRLVLGGLTVLVVFAAGCNRPSANKGRTLYEENGCASCHGPEGHGDGPLAPNLPAKPIDLHDASLFQRGSSEGAIAETLKEGIAVVHTSPTLHHTHHQLLMPSFAHLTEAERKSIALYVISLRNQEDQRRIQQ